MASGLGEHRTTQVKFEELMVVCRARDRELDAFVHELLAELFSNPSVGNVASSAAQIEGIFVVFEGKRVQGISPVAEKVPLLRRRNDEGVQPSVVEERAHRMKSRTTVRSHRTEEREANSEVVQQLCSPASEIRLLVPEFDP